MQRVNHRAETPIDPLIEVWGGGVCQTHQGDTVWQVQDVNLRVRPGEIVTLIGPNGSGKSTTIRMALGIVAPSVGQVWRRPKLRVGYVPQTLSLDATLPLKVDRFMQLTGPVHNAEQALERAGVGHLESRDMQSLSGGQRQRVLFARAIARKPDLLVLDEPVQNVDATGQVEIYDLIREVRDEIGCGVLLISHDLHIVMAATDHVICLNGHVCCQGSPRTVAASESYQGLFGTDGHIALYTHDHDHTHE